MTGPLHGIVLRVVSMSARLALLTWVLPGLAAGEITRYLLLSTLAALGGRLLGLGLEEELPLVVRGDHALARRLHPIGRYPLLGAVACALAALVGGPRFAPALAVGAGALAVASTLILVGLLRTLSPARYEWLLNAPAVLHLLLAGLTPGLDAPRLVLLGAGAQVATGLAIAASAGLLQGAPGAAGVADWPALLRGGSGKLAGNLLFLGQVRALGWLPPLTGQVASDAVSYAVLVGDAAFQLGVVLVQRHFAAYARGEGSPRLAARRGALAGAGLLLAAVAVGTLPLTSPIAALDLGAAAWALVQAGALVAALEVRSFLWSRRVAGGPLLLAQMVWLAALAVVVLALPEPRWLPGAAAVTCLFASGALLGLARWSPSAPPERLP